MDEVETKTIQEEKEIQANPPQIVQGGAGINLMSQLTDQEIKSVEKKQTVDLRSVIFILVVAIISVGFVFYTNHIKKEYEKEVQLLESLEKELEADISTINSNHQILTRYNLFNYVQNNFFSSKEVLVFWQEVSKDLCEIRSIELSSDLEYEIQGVSSSLLNVAKFWHFLSIDSRVSEVELANISLPDIDSEDSVVSFSFSGVLNIKYFDK